MTEINWIKIVDDISELTFGDNNIASVEVEGKAICIGRFEEQIFAFPQKCPHAGADLSNGFVDRLGNVVCPLHHYRFSLINGRNVTGEGYLLKRYRVEERQNGVYIELPA